jgi:GNAT superfamily N-acetyltransferase
MIRVTDNPLSFPMYELVPIHSPEAWDFLAPDPALPKLDPAALARARPDEHWIAHDGEALVARASLWHTRAPLAPGERAGVIGHYAARDPESADAILRQACARLAEAGCTLAIGPMDGDTWHAYRFVIERGDDQPFFLEPDHPPDWPAHWTAAGFQPLAIYHSTLAEDVSARPDDHWQGALQRLERTAGVRLRSLDPARWEDELRRIYAVAEISFRANFLYTPLSEAGFLELYRPLRERTRPELVLLAEDGAGQPVGFVFALPDWLQTARGETVDTIIVKTVAVLPGRTNAGLGRGLIGAVQAAGRALGYRRAIHALMHETNVSRQLSARFGTRPMRRYALFSRRLR